MAGKANRYVVCLANEGYRVSLERRKLYVAIPDREADKTGFMRVIDESGEDYLYPKELFAPIRIPTGLARAL